MAKSVSCSTRISTHCCFMFARRVESIQYISNGFRQFSSTPRTQRKHIDHYATLSVPRSATKVQIKTSYYQLSKKHHPDIAKDRASQSKFHAVSEAYAILGDDRKRREYDRSLGSPFHASHSQGHHPQATTTRPSHQPGFKHFWPNHPGNRTRDPGSHPRHDRPADAHTDPFLNPSVQKATGFRRTRPSTASQSSYVPPNSQGGYAAWTASRSHGSGMSEGRGHTVDNHDRPTQDEAAAQSGVLRALGASGLVGVIMLIAAIGGNSKWTS
ncbi:hypothetical protein JVU11DRAFT_8044 [Chiua virens]|nr:hypothetical protein JVU11DRAFT_8044 [Chiua virens]